MVRQKKRSEWPGGGRMRMRSTSKNEKEKEMEWKLEGELGSPLEFD